MGGAIRAVSDINMRLIRIRGSFNVFYIALFIPKKYDIGLKQTNILRQ